MLICVTDRKQCQGDFLQRVEDIARLGASKIILREKDLSPEEYERLLCQCWERCEPYGVPVVANTQWWAAQHLGIGHLHLPLHLLRQMGRPDWVHTLSTSVHSAPEAKEAQQLGADFLLAGHVFATQCKAGLEPRGLEFVRAVSDAVDIPVCPIGGITPERAPSVLQAGAQGVCVMSGLMVCQDIQQEMARWKNILGKVDKQ